MDRPCLDTSSIPKEQRQAAFALESLLASMAAMVRQVQHGVKLINFARERTALLLRLRPQLELDYSHDDHKVAAQRAALNDWRDSLDEASAWARHATRSSLLVAASLKECIASVEVALKECPALADRVSRTGRSEAGKIFRGSFPDLEMARDMVAHPGEIYAKPSDLAKNTLRSGFSGHGMEIQAGASVIIDEMHGFTEDGFRITGTFRGKVVTIELGHEQLEALNCAVSAVWSDFEGAEDPFFASLRTH